MSLYTGVPHEMRTIVASGEMSVARHWRERRYLPCPFSKPAQRPLASTTVGYDEIRLEQDWFDERRGA